MTCGLLCELWYAAWDIWYIVVPWLVLLVLVVIGAWKDASRVDRNDWREW